MVDIKCTGDELIIDGKRHSLKQLSSGKARNCMPVRVKPQKSKLIECEYALKTPIAFNIDNEIHVVANDIKALALEKTCEVTMFSSSALRWALLDKDEVKQYSRSKYSRAHATSARSDKPGYSKDGKKPINKFIKPRGKKFTPRDNKPRESAPATKE